MSAWQPCGGVTKKGRRSWCPAPPLLTMLSEQETRRDAYPFTWEQQRIFFAELPGYLHRLALFKVNTGIGCREQEVCRLKWEYEIEVQELHATVFLTPWDVGGRLPRSSVNNRRDRLVVLNSVARSVIEDQRGQHSVWVFPIDGKPAQRKR